MTNLINCFPTPVLLSEKYQFSEHELELLRTGPWKANRQGNKTSSSSAVLEDSGLQALKEFIKEQLSIYLHEVIGLSEDARFRITQSWTNLNPTGTSHHMHKHPNSIVSGVLFVEGESCPLTLVRDSGIFGSFSFRFKKGKSSLERLKIENEEGRLILFPSALRHEVEANSSAKLRYSLAFNTFFTGECGNKNKLTYLKV
jgi:uncharacterized protein (TIGR02466 family)